MRISEQWLREWAKLPLGSARLAEGFTMAGLELEAREPAGADLRQVCVAQIVAVEKHPNADRLRICRVRDGRGESSVVTAADNVRPDLKAPLARPGVQLPNGMRMEERRLRGVLSQGMLCSSDELLLEGLDTAEILELPDDAEVGCDLHTLLGLEDQLLSLDVTPNRGDCLSVLGLAREAACFGGGALQAPRWDAVPLADKQVWPVRVDAPSACPHYAGRIVRDLDPDCVAPLWLRERLRRCGMRSVNAVVDVSNYVLLETGQPLHAFDLEQLEGGIVVRFSRPGESFTLLDGKQLALADRSLLIADQARPLALAGIMGGLDSAVRPQTRHVFLESAFFSPAYMAGRARQYGLQTDASMRFERGVDWRLPRLALERASALLMEIAGGKAAPVTDVVHEEALPRPADILLRAPRMRDLLGVSVRRPTVTKILRALGLEVREVAEGWRARSPSHRFDLQREEDLVEEVARIYGYQKLPERAPRVVVSRSLAQQRSRETQTSPAALRRQVAECGYREVICYSFLAAEYLRRFPAPEGAAAELLPLKNPLSGDMNTMRHSLLPGLVQTLQFNRRHRREQVRVFETGMCFANSEGGELHQEEMLAGLAWGRRTPEGWWHGAGAGLDFYDLKGDVESLLARTGRAEEFAFAPTRDALFQPGRGLELHHKGVPVGRLGVLHPRIPEEAPEEDVFVFELRLAALLERRMARFCAVPRFPEVRRDLAFSVPEALPVQDVLDALRGHAIPHLQELLLFDVFRGGDLPSGEKSIALRFTLQHAERTLREADIHLTVQAVVELLAQRFAAQLREQK